MKIDQPRKASIKPEPIMCDLCGREVHPLDAHMGRINDKLGTAHIDCWNEYVRNGAVNKVSNKSVIIKRDGNMWCAHRDDFTNLQESTAEFGRTEKEALDNLVTEEMSIDRKEMLGDYDGKLTAKDWEKINARQHEALKGFI